MVLIHAAIRKDWTQAGFNSWLVPKRTNGSPALESRLSAPSANEKYSRWGLFLFKLKWRKLSLHVYITLKKLKPRPTNLSLSLHSQNAHSSTLSDSQS